MPFTSKRKYKRESGWNVRGSSLFCCREKQPDKKMTSEQFVFFSPHCFHIIVCSPDLVLKNYIRAIIDCWPRSDEYHWWQSHFQITCIAFKSFFVFSWYFDSLSLYFDCWHIGIWSKWFNAQNIEHCSAQWNNKSKECGNVFSFSTFFSFSRRE